MNSPIKLPYADSGISDGEILRRRYLIDYFGLTQPVADIRNFKTLNESLEINKDIKCPSQDHVLPEPTRKDKIRVLFALGTGAAKSNPNYMQNLVTLEDTKDFPTFATISDPETYATDGDVKTILPIRTFAVSEKIDLNYAMYKPVQFDGGWYRKFFTKIATVSKDCISRKGGVPTVVAQVVCHIDKKDIVTIADKSTTSTVAPTFNELTLYFGTMSPVKGSPRVLPPAYFVNGEPQFDFIDVVPFYHVVFNDISTDTIPEEGLDIVLEIITKSTEIEVPEDITLT